MASLDAYGTMTPTEPADVLLTSVQSGVFQEMLRKQVGGMPFRLQASLLEDPSFYGRSPYYSLYVRLSAGQESHARQIADAFQSVLAGQFKPYVDGLRGALDEDILRKNDLLMKAQSEKTAYVDQNHRRIEWYERQLALLDTGKPTAVPFGPADRARAAEIMAEYETICAKQESDAEAVAADLKRLTLQKQLTAPFLARELPVVREKIGGLVAAIAGIGAGLLVAAAGTLLFTTYDALFPATRK